MRVFGWFDLAWPWIGLGFAGVLLVMLFATNVLRTPAPDAAGRGPLPRLRDLRWLSFLGTALYMIHNVEEYGIAANGVLHAFPDSLCTVLGQPDYPACGIPPVFYLVVNLPLVWVLGPLAALLARRFPLAGLILWGVIGINALAHIGPAIALREYDPGLLTAVLLFVPLTVLTIRAAFGRRGPYRPVAAVLLLGLGVFMHAVLAGGVLLYLRGALPEWVLLLAQPAAMALSYAVLVAADPRLRRASPTA